MESKRFCTNCKILLVARHKVKFCSNKCQKLYEHIVWVKDWKNGTRDGNVGINARNFSKHLKIYLINKFENKCCVCGWNEKHPITGIVPLEIDHIDGNSENNFEDNLRLICPNCHALTPFYKNLNRGNGRKWRMQNIFKPLIGEQGSEV